jgi:hypothetical protein
MLRLVYRKRAAARHTPAVLAWSHTPDFVLFGHVTLHLKGMAFASHEGLLASIGQMVTDVLKETLHRVFDH